MTPRLQVFFWGVLGLGAPAVVTGVPEPPEVTERARLLGSKFGGGRRCDPDAFVALAALRREHGVHGTVGKAVALAYRGCDDDLAWAELFAERIRDDDTDMDRLQLAAAWISAHRWREAYAVASPLAERQGPQSQAAWLVGYALFELDEHERAAKWLLGARGTVDGKRRSDAPVMLAMAQLDTGDADAARAELVDAVERMPDSPSLHAVLAVVLQRTGDRAEAQRVAEKAKRLALAFEDEARPRRRFDNLRTSWLHAIEGGDTASADRLLDALVAQGPADPVRALLSARAIQLERDGDTEGGATLRTRIRTLPSE